MSPPPLILESPVVRTDGPIFLSRSIASFKGIEDEDEFFFAAIFQNSDAISISLFFIFQSEKYNQITKKFKQDNTNI
jgi:hypothetical protein